MTARVLCKNIDITDIDVKYRTIIRRIFHKLDEKSPQHLHIQLDFFNASDVDFFNRLIQTISSYNKIDNKFAIYVDDGHIKRSSNDRIIRLIDYEYSPTFMKIQMRVNARYDTYNTISFPTIYSIDFEPFSLYFKYVNWGMINKNRIHLNEIYLFTYFVSRTDSTDLSSIQNMYPLLATREDEISKIFIKILI